MAGGEHTPRPAGHARAFDPEAFQLARTHAGCSWGEQLHYWAECPSTNDEALQAARRGERHGALFVADHQLQGRGQRGRRWLAAPRDALLFSVLLRPTADRPLDSTLTLAVGLAVRATLSSLLQAPHEVCVKWPNDVWIDSRKVCGILCEAHASGDQLRAIVVGVGLNVLSRDFPRELQSSATSLLLSGAQVPSRESLLAQILAESERRLLPRAPAALIAELGEHDALRDRNVSVDTHSGRLSGVARGIDSQGRLLLETTSGLTPILAGTVHVES